MLNACKIDTVDSYQGKENPVVILSLVRNNADGPEENGRKTIAQGYMQRPNRINVALSRAMDRLVVVGASEHWPYDGPMAQVAEKFQELARSNAAEFVKASGATAPEQREKKARVTRTRKSTKTRRSPK